MSNKLRRFLLTGTIISGLLTVAGSVFWFAMDNTAAEAMSPGMAHYNNKNYIEAAKPSVKTTSKPTQVVKPSVKTTSKPTQVVKPSVKTTAKPTQVVKPSVKTTSKPTQVVKPSIKTTAKPTQVVKPSVKTTSKPTQVVKPSVKMTAKPKNTQVVKPSVKTTAKPRATRLVKPSGKTTAKQRATRIVKPFRKVTKKPKKTQTSRKPSRRDAEEPEPPQADSEESNNTGIFAEDEQNAKRAESSCPENQYALTVNATPATSRIRIMNIQPKYRPGICLTPRRYDIYVTHRGYHSYRKWTTLQEAEVSVEVTLRQIVKSKTYSSKPLVFGIPGKYPQSSTRRLIRADIRGKSKWTLSLMRNEIYARHGYIFSDPNLKRYFENQSWYSGKTTDATKVYYRRLSQIERDNVEFIRRNEIATPKSKTDSSSSKPLVFWIPGKYPQSSTRRLIRADIRGQSKWTLSLMRNEIYARHGYIFSDPNLKRYFENQSWYSGKTTDATKVYYRRLSQIERDNVKFLRRNE
jgi:hypothetical protein